MTSPLTRPRPVGFNQQVDGTWGEFVSPAGRVAYLMTNARLGSRGVDNERRLTARLRPVREVLNVRDMDFAQILQRDLDDHRVATDLVPYLLQAHSHGPAFLPPILAVLLPFEDNGDAGAFPALASRPSVGDDLGLTWREDAYGSSFRVRRLVDDDGGDHPAAIGQVSWNEENTKVVVLDGQHRAMALLAIERTLRATWDQEARGAKYRHFYETRVRAALEAAGADSVDMLQVPVTLCWFPDQAGEQGRAHMAARKLFVDVNRNARPPSRDRLVLLSDNDLLNVFTRHALDRLGSPAGRGDGLPLFAVEYDNPRPGLPGQGRWSTIVTLQSLRTMVERTVFGPAKYLQDLSAAERGRQPDEDPAFMREQLDVQAVLTSELTDAQGRAFAREDLARGNFPRGAVDDLNAAFMAGWGAGLLHLLSETAPFQAHHRTLRMLDATWTPSEPGVAEALAREAVLEGVGMYWTLRESVRADSVLVGPAPDVEAAWRIVRARGEEFRKDRAAAYVGTVADQAVQARVDRAFEVLGSQAAQVGLALLLGGLAYAVDARGPALLDLAMAIADALNVALEGDLDGVDRRLVLSSDEEASPNMIVNMNTPRAVEFRYLWLELLCLAQARAVLVERTDMDETTLLGLRDTARGRYVDYLIDERYRQRRRERPGASKDALRNAATLEVTGDLQTSLERWFGIDRAAFLEWARGLELMTNDDPDGDLDPAES